MPWIAIQIRLETAVGPELRHDRLWLGQSRACAEPIWLKLMQNLTSVTSTNRGVAVPTCEYIVEPSNSPDSQDRAAPWQQSYTPYNQSIIFSNNKHQYGLVRYVSPLRPCTRVALTLPIDNNRDSHQEVYGDGGHEAKFSHELVGGAAAFEAMKLFEDKQRREGIAYNQICVILIADTR